MNRDKILIPIIAQTRADYGERKAGIPIPEELKAFIWCAIDLEQIDNIIDDNSLTFYKENNLGVNKQNAERYAKEQA